MIIQKYEYNTKRQDFKTVLQEYNYNKDTLKPGVCCTSSEQNS